MLAGRKNTWTAHDCVGIGCRQPVVTLNIRQRIPPAPGTAKTIPARTAGPTMTPATGPWMPTDRAMVHT